MDLKHILIMLFTETVAKIIKIFLNKKPKHEMFNLSSKKPEKLIDLVNFIKRRLKSTSIFIRKLF